MKKMNQDEGAVRVSLSKSGATGSAVRLACRDGQLSGHTSGLAPGYAQANLVFVPKAYAYDFLLYCARNPKPCPLLEVTEAGQAVLAHRVPAVMRGEGDEVSPLIAPGARSVAPGADLRRDAPRYAVWKAGVCTDTPTDISHLWLQEGEPCGAAPHPDARSDWVAFLLGCSFSFEDALLQAGLPVRHLQEGRAGAEAVSLLPARTLVSDPRNVPMYRTLVPTAPSGPFAGPLVVSMRPMTVDEAVRAREITAQYPRVHGSCVAIGDAASLGIRDLSSPDYGDAVTILADEVPVFWACGVTPQAALIEAKLPIAITHAPGHMLVLDVRNEELAGEAGVM